MPRWAVVAGCVAGGAILGYVLTSPVVGPTGGCLAAGFGCLPGLALAQLILDRGRVPVPPERPAGFRVPLLAGLAVGLTAGAYLLLWHEVVTSCEPTPNFGCLGNGLVMMVIGLPVTAAVMWVGLWRAGVRHPALGLGLVALFALVAPQLVTPLDLPTLVWPVALGLLAASYAAVIRRF